MNLIKIGNHINNQRKDQKITQEQLGIKLGVSSQAVSNWEQGKNLPDTSLLIDLSIILDTSIETILNGGEPNIKESKHVNVRNVIKGIDNLSTIRELLGDDNTIYKFMIEGISKGMNTNFEELLSSNYLREILVVEVLLQNHMSGHYINPKEVDHLLQYDKTKKLFMESTS